MRCDVMRSRQTTPTRKYWWAWVNLYRGVLCTWCEPPRQSMGWDSINLADIGGTTSALATSLIDYDSRIRITLYWLEDELVVDRSYNCDSSYMALYIWCCFEIRDQGLQRDIDFKAAFSKADILHHSYKVQNINFIVTELVQYKHVDVTNTKIISRMICFLWVVLLYQSSHWYALYACGISRQWHIGIELARLKTCSVIPGGLSEQAISKYGMVASYFGIAKMKILKIMR